jgi:predicted NBD/HSP70 family sugar kinase
MLDPGLVIVGGELATTGDALLDPIRDSIDRETSRAAGHPYAVMAGALGPRAEVLGAAALAMDSESRELLRPLGAPDSAARTTSKHQTAS